MVARVSERRGLLPLSILVISASVATSLLAGRITLLSVGASLLLGQVVGLASRVILGHRAEPADRAAPSRTHCSAPCPTSYAWSAPTAGGRDGRRYRGLLADGRCLDVLVLDRDLEGSGLGYRLWRLLQLRGPAAGRTLVSVQRTVERDALMTYALITANVRTPRLVGRGGGGPVRCPPGLPVRRRQAAVGAAARRRRRARARGLMGPAGRRAAGAAGAPRADRGEHPASPPKHDVVLVGVRGGEVAATDLHLRLDVAQLVTTLSLAAGPQAAVRSGAAAIGPEALLSALPILQPLVLARTHSKSVAASAWTARRGA